MKTLRRRIFLGGFAALFIVVAATYFYGGAFLAHSVLRHGIAYWLVMTEDGPRLSPTMRLALSGHVDASSGPFIWQAIEPGFETADLPVMVEGHEVDQIHLARIDSAHFRFIVRSGPEGDRDVDHWEKELGAVLVVNGSYFQPSGEPETPLVSDGKALGPKNYDAKGGAFIASPDFTGIRDLAGTDWKHAFENAREAMVSYPMLLADGSNKVVSQSRWLANRSFLGQDSTGRIIIGTTQDAFFSLARLADFLRAAPLDLKTALNLDGGPIATQAIDLNGYHRRVYGLWEARVEGSSVELLTWPWGSYALPVVIAVAPK